MLRINTSVFPPAVFSNFYFLGRKSSALQSPVAPFCANSLHGEREVRKGELAQSILLSFVLAPLFPFWKILQPVLQAFLASFASGGGV